MTWAYTQGDLEAAARVAASTHNLEYSLVAAVIEQESNWHPWALRYEPAFYLRYIVPLKLSPTEGHSRSFSWGLMQVMGQVARELGYNGDFPRLCEPSVGLEWGCLHLAKKIKAHSGNLVESLLAWNGGANLSYPDEVMARMVRYPAQVISDADLSTQV